MSRPSHNTDRKLIAVARKMLPKTGCSGLSLREVARKASVNLGMFHYHFKTKDEFIRRVLGEIYNDFFIQFEQQTQTPVTPPLQRLEGALFELGRFGRDNRDIIVALIKDMLNGNKAVTRFIGQLVQKHIVPTLAIIKECQKAKLLPENSAAQLLPQLVIMINGPHLALGMFEHIGIPTILDRPLKEMRDNLLDDGALKKRVQAIIHMTATSGRSS